MAAIRTEGWHQLRGGYPTGGTSCGWHKLRVAPVAPAAGGVSFRNRRPLPTLISKHNGTHSARFDGTQSLRLACDSDHARPALTGPLASDLCLCRVILVELEASVALGLAQPGLPRSFPRSERGPNVAPLLRRRASPGASERLVATSVFACRVTCCHHFLASRRERWFSNRRQAPLGTVGAGLRLGGAAGRGGCRSAGSRPNDWPDDSQGNSRSDWPGES